MLDKSADAPLKPNISVSIIASDDIMIASHVFNVAVREIMVLDKQLMTRYNISATAAAGKNNL